MLIKQRQMHKKYKVVTHQTNRHQTTTTVNCVILSGHWKRPHYSVCRGYMSCEM